MIASKFSLLGLYGGTFDPIHLGHLQIAEELLGIINFHKLIFIPSGTPRLRHAPSASMTQRAEMVGLAIQNMPMFTLDEREIRRTGISVSIDTLQEYRIERTDQEAICFILGMDAFIKLPKWQNWQMLFELCHLIIVNRPGYRTVADDDLLPELKVACKDRWVSHAHDLENQRNGFIFNALTSMHDISATKIRALIANRDSVSHLLPEVVAAYIQANNLYVGKV